MHRIFLIGYMGAGKTTIGKILARKMNLTFIDLDSFIEQRYHKTVSLLFHEKGEQGFREIERLMLHEVAEFENVVVSTGGGTPIFFDNIEYMNAKGCSVYLEASSDLLTERLRKGADKRPLIAGKTIEELRAFITQTLTLRNPYYQKATLRIPIDGEHHTIDQIVAQIITRYST
ncbi:MAG: shikimate kinase [Bacteroidales bacterium]